MVIRRTRVLIALMSSLALAACSAGGGNNSTDINAPSAIASANNATDREAPGSGTGDGTGSDASTGALESTTQPEIEGANGAATATSTGDESQGDPNVTVLSLGVGGEPPAYTRLNLTAPADRELQISFANSTAKPHNWVLVEPGKEQAVADSKAEGSALANVDGVIAWGETVTGGETRITVPPLPRGDYPYLSTLGDEAGQLKGVLNVQ